MMVGVKCPDGSEILHIRDTSAQPDYWTDIDFLMGEQSALERWEDKQTKCFPLIRRIRPNDYGVVLIDFPRRKIFSRQGYANPSRICVADYMRTRAKNIIRLYAEGLIGKINPIDDDIKEFNEEETWNWFLGLEKTLANPRRYCMATVVQIKAGWSYDHARNYVKDWHKAIEFTKAGGWSSPIVNPELVYSRVKAEVW
jgi:hypothetical protein